jgi:aryl-alcohol dehydrogenase-like predicted oxidoreductase
MQYRQLGASGIKVSTITIGTMTFGAGKMLGETDVKGATRQIDLCLDKGVNIIDTANAYAAGKSEQIIGEVLAKEGRRQRLLVATKVRFPMGKGPNDLGLSRHHIVAQCEASLKRLRADVIDLYQVHQWDGLTPLEETIEALDTLVRHGKVRYIGCSNYSGWHVMKALAVSDARHQQRFVSQQIHYTLQAREAEYELVPISVDQGLGILAWSPIAGGLLSGKYRRGKSPEEGGRHMMGWKEPPIYDEDKLYDIVDVIVAIAEARGVSGAQVALAWLLSRPWVTSVVIGGRTDAQFADNLGAAELELSEDEIARLEKISRPPLIYPYWHQNMAIADRLNKADMALHAPYLADKKA